MTKHKSTGVRFVVHGLCGLLLSYSGIANSQVIFRDDFEDDPSDWDCRDGSPVKWEVSFSGCGVDATFGSEWKMGPGRDGGNAIYAWKSASVPNGYRSENNKWLSGSNLRQEIYHRWHMKWDPQADKRIGEGFKFWRYITRENGYSNPPVIYLNARSSGLLSAGDLVIYNDRSDYLILAPMSSFADNEWHAHELRIKLNDVGASNGEIQYWLDGVLTATHGNLSFGDASNMRFHRFGVGIGNASDSSWNNSAWAAIAFDNVVVSTSYVGPDPQIAPEALTLSAE